jgi:hypothetical protein
MRGAREGGGRRGAALVLVMVFGIGALSMVVTLLSLTQSGAKTSAELQRQRNLNVVLKAGIAAALNELNRNISAAYDPGADGVGALTRPGASGATTGIPLTVATADGQTRTLGFYRTTIVKDSSNRDILRVVAAWPSFTAPASQQELAAAELQVTVGAPMGDFRPFNISGSLSPSKVNFDIKSGADIDTVGIDVNPSGHTDPDQANVPGANVTDSRLVGASGEFITQFVNKSDEFFGSDPNDPGSTAQDANTVTNNQSSTFNDTTLQAARAHYTSQLDAVLDTNAFTTLLGGSSSWSGSGGSTPTIIGTGGTYVVSSPLTISGKVKGSGTLYVKRSITIASGADFEWDGDIIIAGYDGSHAIAEDATFNLNNGAELDLDGNLVMLGSDVTLNAQSGHSTNTVIDGALLLMSNDTKTVTMNMDTAGFTVEGVTVTYSEKFHYDGKAGSNPVFRSLNTVFTGTDSGNDLHFEIAGKLDLRYDNTQVVESMSGIWSALGSTVQGKLEANSYWERASRQVLADQATQLSSGSSWGRQ